MLVCHCTRQMAAQYSMSLSNYVVRVALSGCKAAYPGFNDRHQSLTATAVILRPPASSNGTTAMHPFLAKFATVCTANAHSEGACLEWQASQLGQASSVLHITNVLAYA